jgi:hypothetical protein
LSEVVRTTIMVDSVLLNRVNEHCKSNGDTLTSFYNKALLNQLENDGDFEIRDILEEENKKWQK